MNKFTVIPVVGMVCLVIGGAVAYQRKNQSDWEQVNHRLQQQLTKAQLLEDHTNQLSARVSGLSRAKREDPERAPLPQTTLPGATLPKQTHSLEPQAKPPQQSFEQYQEHALSVYAKEARDATWSRAATEELDKLLRPRLPGGSRLVSIDCRSTLCLVDVAINERDASNQFSWDAFAGWGGAVLVAHQAEAGNGVAMSYLAARPGRDLPAMAAD